MTTPTPRLAYRLNQIVELSGMSLWAVNQAIKTGDLKAKRRGRSVIVPAAEAERWIASLEDA